MKVLKLLVVMVFVLLLFFTVGCASRPNVKPNTTADETGTMPVPTEQATAAPTPVEEQAVKYVVKKGDTLWGISTINDIYADPFQWPLLYKANRDQIKDPDIIEVGQELDVKKDYSQTQVSDAIQKAKDTPPYKPHTTPRKSLPLKY